MNVPAFISELVRGVSGLAVTMGQALDLRGIKPGGSPGQIPVKSGEADFMWSWGEATGKISEGSNITITGTGTSADPYVISATGALAATVNWEDVLLKPAWTGTFDGTYASLDGKPSFGTAAFVDSSTFATSAQGTLASTALQPTSSNVTVMTSVGASSGQVPTANGEGGIVWMDQAGGGGGGDGTVTSVAISGTGLSVTGSPITTSGTFGLAVIYGSVGGTSCQGNDSRLSNSREWTAATVDQAEAEAGTATTRRAFTSQRVRQAIVAWWATVSGTKADASHTHDAEDLSGVAKLFAPTNTYTNSQQVFNRSTGESNRLTLAQADNTNDDPGTPLVVEGRGSVVHAFTIIGGFNRPAQLASFTSQSDHSHMQWNTVSRSNWQMIQNGPASTGNGNCFTLNTVGEMKRRSANNLPQERLKMTTLDTTQASTSGSENNLELTNVILNGSSDFITSPTSQPWAVGGVYSLRIVPGFAGIVAGTYAARLTENSTNRKVFTLFIGNGFNFEAGAVGEIPPENPDFPFIQLAADTLPGTKVSIAGLQDDNPLWVRVNQTGIGTNDPASPVFAGMPVMLVINNATTVGLTVGTRSGYVREVGPDHVVVSLLNHSNPAFSYGSNTSTPDTTVANFDLLYGNADSVHQAPAAWNHIRFDRFPTGGVEVGSMTVEKSGGNRSATIGCGAEVFFAAKFAYSIGFMNAVAGDFSAALGGQHHLVTGTGNVALGGQHLVTSNLTNCLVIGEYNEGADTYVNSLVIGGGTSAEGKDDVVINKNGIWLDGVLFSSGGGATTFLDLTDTPAAYTGQAGKLVKVDPTGEFLTFGDPSGASVSWGDITGTIADQTDLTPAAIGAAADNHSHDATAIVSGLMATAVLGTGTADSTTFLRGDRTWQEIKDSSVSATPDTLVLRGNQGQGQFASTTGTALTVIAGDSGTGADISSGTGTGATIFSADGTHLIVGDNSLIVSNAGLIQLGGQTASFPALKRNGTGIEVRLADDSGFGPITASNLSGTNSGDQDLSGLLEKSTVTVKGDILAATASATIARVGVGANGHVLTADSEEAAGIKWSEPPAGGAGIEISATPPVDTDVLWADTSGDDVGNYIAKNVKINNYVLADSHEEFTIEDAHAVCRFNLADDYIVQVPLHAAVPFDIGTYITIVQIGNGTIQLTQEAGVDLNNNDGLTTDGQYTSIVLVKVAENTWDSFGGTPNPI